MKTIDVVLIPNIVNHQQVTGSVAIVIDVLRARSTMLTALSNGAKQIIPVISKPMMKILLTVPGLNSILFKKIREKLTQSFG